MYFKLDYSRKLIHVGGEQEKKKKGYQWTVNQLRQKQTRNQRKPLPSCLVEMKTLEGKSEK